MDFITKLDFSSNRQIKQYPETNTHLSGGTTFGMPFSSLVSGPDLTTSGVTSSITGGLSTFSGTTGTTVYTQWRDSRMQLAYSTLSAITPSNSAITQNTGIIFTAATSTVIDGNTVNLSYTGVSFDITPIAMISLGGGNYSGTSYSQTINFYSAGTLDYTGRTIWVDVSGITRTNTLLADNIQLTGLNTAPASSGDTGTTGQIKISNGFIYVCVATNTWKRATLSAF
jgi:hypothetical protein